MDKIINIGGKILDHNYKSNDTEKIIHEIKSMKGPVMFYDVSYSHPMNIIFYIIVLILLIYIFSQITACLRVPDSKSD